MKQLFTILLFLTVFGITNAQDCLLDKKPVQNLVQDYADVLSDVEEQGLRNALNRFNDTTSTQILVVTVNDLCGYDKAEFTYTLGEKWGVGQKGKNNGIVVMVKPHGGKGQRHVFIAPGYGLEGVLPDAIAKRIVENEMIPRFKENDFYGGIANGVAAIISITSGEYTADDYVKKVTYEKYIPFLFILFIFILIMIVKASRTRKYAHTNGMGFWAAWALMNASSRSHGGSFGNFGSGGGSFGGFGGGSFGGGGSGGSW
ncbi:MAG: TPM domain-containing protein [Vicingus serpentipes]|nr:TPM domain-containing protein [Vicingus serpentipes]